MNNGKLSLPLKIAAFSAVGLPLFIAYMVIGNLIWPHPIYFGKSKTALEAYNILGALAVGLLTQYGGKALLNRIGGKNTLPVSSFLLKKPEILLYSLFAIAAAGWLTHLVVCLQKAKYVLLLIGVIMPPIGSIHGIGTWFNLWP